MWRGITVTVNHLCLTNILLPFQSHQSILRCAVNILHSCVHYNHSTFTNILFLHSSSFVDLQDTWHICCDGASLLGLLGNYPLCQSVSDLPHHHRAPEWLYKINLIKTHSTGNETMQDSITSSVHAQLHHEVVCTGSNPSHCLCIPSVQLTTL